MKLLCIENSKSTAEEIIRLHPAVSFYRVVQLSLTNPHDTLIHTIIIYYRFIFIYQPNKYKLFITVRNLAHGLWVWCSCDSLEAPTMRLLYYKPVSFLFLPAMVIIARVFRNKKKNSIQTYVQLLCFFLFISLRLQFTVMLLEDKMTKRHKFTIKERKNRRQVNRSERESKRERERERERERDLTI